MTEAVTHAVSAPVAWPMQRRCIPGAKAGRGDADGVQAACIRELAFAMQTRSAPDAKLTAADAKVVRPGCIAEDRP